MFIPKKHRQAIYQYLFREGVLVVSTDVFAAKHSALEVPNLHVLSIMQSFKSKSLVKEQFNWHYLYYSLTDKGVAYLRQALYIPSEVEPNTHKRSDKAQPSVPSFVKAREDREALRRSANRGGREEYRGKREEGDDSRGGRGGYRGRGRGGRGRGGFRGGRGGSRADREERFPRFFTDRSEVPVRPPREDDKDKKKSKDANKESKEAPKTETAAPAKSS